LIQDAINSLQKAN